MRPTIFRSAASLTGAALIGATLLASCAGSGAPPADPGAGSAGAQGAQPPYASLQERAIKALAPERVADLRAGRGAGYALAAELNHYPGPSHVLELKDQLALRPEQERATRELFAAMQREARVLGERLVELEAQLDAAFAGGTATMTEVAQLTAEIAATEGRLRAVHLSAHLDQKELLTNDQVARYDRLRGYAGGASATAAGHEQGPGHHRR